MLTLAIDTSSPATSIALLEDDAVRAIYREEHEHPPSDAAFAILDRFLRSERLRPRDIQLFAACEGPGSFTGLRIGLGMMKTFGHALNRPVIGVDSVSAAALGILRARPGLEAFGVVVPGFKKTNFLGRFAAVDGEAKLQGTLDHADGAGELEAWMLAADRPCFAPRALAFPDDRIMIVGDTEAPALSIARIASDRSRRNDVPEFDAIQPRYLKPFNIGAKARRPEDLR